MANNPRENSTPDYSVGYEDAAMHRLGRFTAASDAAYLLPYMNKGMRVLDVGCGPGTISVGLAAAVDPGEFHGIDMEVSQVERAALAGRQAGLANARFQVADALDLPFPDGHFDVVHCHTLFMHVPDTMAVLAEIKRVLRTGGIVGAREAIIENSFTSPDVGNLKNLPIMVSNVLSANGGHPQMGKELRSRFDEAGFVEIEATGALETWGSPSTIPAITSYLLEIISPKWADTAVAQGLATQQDVDAWRETILGWSKLPGAFAAYSWGEAIGRKP